MAKTVKKSAKKKTAKKKTAKKTVKKTAVKKTVKKKTAAKKAAKKSVKKKTAKKSAVKKTVKKASKKKTTAKQTVKKAAKKTVKKKTAVKAIAKQKRPLRKSRHKKSSLTTKELGFFTDVLLQKRREIVGDVNQMENEALKKSRLDASGDLSSMPIHMADMGTDNFEQEFSINLMDSERRLLQEINGALNRIVEKKYGLCEGTGKEISKARLEANPWAKYCIEYATMVEKGQVVEGEKLIDENDGYDDDFMDNKDDSKPVYDLLDYEEMEDEEDENY